MLKVLVVDDSKFARLSLIKMVKNIKKDVEFFQAEDGEKAIEIFKQNRPQIVFLDLTMPVLSGYEVLKKIKKIDFDTQVVVVSADIQSEAKRRVLSSGAAVMCPKPITDEKMLAIFTDNLKIED